MDPDAMQLPPHLKHEATALRNSARTDNPVTEMQARPLLKSTIVWLARNGTVNREDSPGVIQKAGDLLHILLPLHMCQVPKGRTKATDFAARLFSFFQNHVTRGTATFKINVKHDEALNTPMRAMDEAGLVLRLKEGDIPPQGHSGRSILGKSVSRTPDTELDDGPLPVAPQGETGSAAAAPDRMDMPPPYAHTDRTDLPPPSHASSTPLTSAAILNAFAARAGLDINVMPSARSGGTAGLPPPQPPPNTTPPNPTPPNQTTRGKKAPPTKAPPTKAPPTKAPPPKAPPPKVLRPPKVPVGATEAPAPAATAAKRSKPSGAHFQPTLPFADSKHSDMLLSHEPLQVGKKLAFYMELPEHKGGTEYYIGTVSRMSKTSWADVDFPDGKLWCSVKESERGARWVALL